jgi:alanine racemase
MNDPALNTLAQADQGEPGILTIDLAAIQANWQFLNVRSGGAGVGAVVKADAYGLGLEPVAKALWDAGARRFYVAQSGEGAALRQVLPDAAIVVLAPVLPHGFANCRESNLIPTLNGPEALAHWRDDAAAHNHSLPANIHVDSGMTRLGFDDAEFPAVFADLSEIERRTVVEISSHLACADDPTHPLNQEQLARFTQAIAAVPSEVLRSFANSSGICLGEGFAAYAARPGMALYGLNPTPNQPNPMRPVLSLHVRILQTRKLSRGESVGYGATATAHAGARIAVIAAGYADGLHRCIGDDGRVWINGEAAPILGRISMDLIAVDVSHMLESDVVSGGWAEVIGPHQSADDLAAAAGTIGYEILTSLGARYARCYLPASPEGAV